MPKTNPVKDAMEGYIYSEDTSVNKTRIVKTCNICLELIPKGSAHIGAKVFNDEYQQFDICKTCEKRYKLQLISMRNGDYDYE